ncbi:MAG: anhydro-N-acetylmuramic acid kinase [Legionellaceae bacterium]|nr:anhydro-N-acetylmuramic acid kinase [Legionellaceae bacterium]
MNNLYMGVLSGTSMDGIDVAVVDCAQHRLLAANTFPYDDRLHTRIRCLAQGEAMTAAEISQLDRQIGLAFAHACTQLLSYHGLTAQDVCAIGSHGQTVSHNPKAKPANTLQLGCAHTIAYETGMTTVADFRRADIAQGGQGAPLAPLYHRELFKEYPKPLAIVNIGGIANLSWLDDAGGDYGYDTGPGNVLLDAWSEHCRQLAHDDRGLWGKSGTLIPELLTELLKDPYFLEPLPKSLDKEAFNRHWLEAFSPHRYPMVDIQCTLTHFTAKSIALALQHNRSAAKQLIVCGGGAHNDFLLECLRSYCPEIPVKQARELQLDENYIEAMLFAWLAQQRLLNHKLDLRAYTGGRASQYSGIVYSP